MNDDYQEKADQVQQMKDMSPDQLINHLADAHGELAQVAPNVLPHIQATATRAIQFLGSKLPPKGPALFDDREFEPTPDQKANFLAYHKIVNDPVSALDLVKSGRFDQRHMDALSSVYPDLHNEMKTKMTEDLADAKARGHELNYRTRNSIARFMGLPLDSTMTPQSMQAIMATSNAQSQHAATPQNQKKASGVELKQINKVNDIYATKAQARQIDKRA